MDYNKLVKRATDILKSDYGDIAQEYYVVGIGIDINGGLYSVLFVNNADNNIQITIKSKELDIENDIWDLKFKTKEDLYQKIVGLKKEISELNTKINMFEFGEKHKSRNPYDKFIG